MPSKPSAQILFISYDGMTDPLGQSQVLPYLVGLSNLGYRITLLSTEKKENFESRKNAIEKITKENQIDWQYVFYTKKPPILSTLYDIRQLRQKAKQLHQTKNFQIVHCRSYISALVGEYLQKKFNVKFIFDMRGFWADERVDGGLWNLKNPAFKIVYQYFKRKEKDFLQKADYTVSLTENAKQEIQSWHLPQIRPIQVIPCCVDTDLFNAAKTDDDSPKEKTNDFAIHHSPFVISYLGSLGTWYMLDEMLLFFQRLLLKKPDAQFLFITADKPSLIIDRAKAMQIPENQIIIKKAERKEVPILLAESDLAIFFVKPAYSKKASSPTKMGEILGMGLPIIANKGIGDNDFLFEKYHCGCLLKDFTEKSIDKAIEQIENILQIPKMDLRNIALDYFSLKKGVDLYAEVYQHCLLSE